MENILVIRYGTIGDTVFASAFYRELRKNLPDATIDALVDGISSEILKNCPYINNLISLKRKYIDFFYYYNLFKKYSTIYFLKNDNFLSKVAFLSGVKNRIGFNVKRNFMLTKKVPYNNDKHEIDFYLDLLRSCNFEIDSDKIEVWYKKTDKINDITKNINSPKVLIHASSRFSQKNWIKTEWAKVIRYLVNDKDCQLFFVGGKSDKCYYDDILSMSGELIRTPVNLCGELKISETTELVSSMDMMIGIDSGIIHIAAGLDIPSVLLNGPTSLVRWAPRSAKCNIITKNYDCSPCVFASSRNKRCLNRDSECMLAISADEVINCINKIFN